MPTYRVAVDAADPHAALERAVSAAEKKGEQVIAVHQHGDVLLLITHKDKPARQTRVTKPQETR